METTLIMLPTPILVSGEEIEKFGKNIPNNNFVFYSENNSIFKKTDYNICSGNFLSKFCKKIIAGIEGLPSLDLSLIAEEIGCVDIYKLAYKYIQDEWSKDDDTLQFGIKVGFRQGFETAQSLNEKKYSEEDLFNLLKMIHDRRLDSLCSKTVNNGKVTDFNFWNSFSRKEFYASELINEFIKSLSKPKEYNVVVDTHRPTLYSDDGLDYQGDLEPKITNNTIKVLKILKK